MHISIGLLLLVAGMAPTMPMIQAKGKGTSLDAKAAMLLQSVCGLMIRPNKNRKFNVTQYMLVLAIIIHY